MSNTKTWSYHSEWLEENHIVLINMVGDFDEEGIIEMNTHLRDTYLEPASTPINCIIDATKLTGQPTNLKVLREASAISSQHPNMHWIILVGFDNAILRFISGAIGQLLGIKFKQVNSLEEAKKQLKQVT